MPKLHRVLFLRRTSSSWKGRAPPDGAGRLRYRNAKLLHSRTWETNKTVIQWRWWFLDSTTITPRICSDFEMNFSNRSQLMWSCCWSCVHRPTSADNLQTRRDTSERYLQIIDLLESGNQSLVILGFLINPRKSNKNGDLISRAITWVNLGKLFLLYPLTTR